MVQDLGVEGGALLEDTEDADEEEEFGNLDANQDNVLDESEFLALLEDAGRAGQAELDAYDLDADGVLSEDEYNEMVQDLGIEAGELLEDTGVTDAVDQFGDLDANQDDVLDESEFLTLLERAGRAGQAELDAYDLDADGVLNEDEYNEMLQDLGIDEGELIEDIEDATSD